MKIGIIIVTYNSQNDIARIFESIVIQKYENLIVYIVDNNSNDETLKIIQKYKDEITICIISSESNNGFAKGNNIGIKKAIDDGCEIVFILNPDMQMEEKCIDILTKRIASDEKIGAIGPIVLLGDKSDKIIQIYGAKADFKTQRKEILRTGERLTKDLPAEILVDYLLGGAMMVKTSVLKRSGLFEEDYFMYNDELDIAYRIKKAGFQTLCMRDAIVRHFHDFNAKNRRGYNLMYYYVLRNKYLYFRKYRLYNNLLLALFEEFINVPLKIIWSIRRMRNFRILKFYYSGLLDGLLGKKGAADKSFN